MRTVERKGAARGKEEAVLKFRKHRLEHYFSEEDLRTITDAVRMAESTTSGEIRVKIVENCRGETRPYAIKQCYEEGLHRTRDHTGVLILLILKRRAIEIVADTGISAKVPQSTWDDLVAIIASYFKERRYTRGLTLAVLRVGYILATHFPVRKNDVNELPDTPMLGEPQ